MVGHRLGEFAPTKKFLRHGGKMQKEIEGTKFQIKGSSIKGESATLKVARQKGDDTESGEIAFVRDVAERTRDAVERRRAEIELAELNASLDQQVEYLCANLTPKRNHRTLELLAIFLAGTVVMRSAGCVINDFADRNIDPFVKRTQDRPLAARRLSPQEALGLFFALLVIALWLRLVA